MELHEAIKIIISHFSIDILSDRKFINALQDYYHFDVPAKKRIVASLVEDGQLRKLANCVDVKLEINRIADYEFKNRGYQIELTKNVLLSCAKGLGLIISSLDNKAKKTTQDAIKNTLENGKKVEVSNRPKFFFQGIYGDTLDKIQKTMEIHPGALMDSATQGDKKIYRVYWLAIGPDINGKAKCDNNIFFDVKFSIREDLQGMLVSITNICEEPVDVDWRSFRINRCKTHVEGIVWALYNESGIIMPGEVKTRMVQPSIYNKGKVEKMFDLDEIKKKEFIYEVSFNVKCGKNRKRNYSYNVYTKLKIII